MEPTFEHFDFPETSVIAARRVEPRYLFDWHFHPHYELTLIVAGRGTRFVGHRVDEYEPGDLVLLGPNLPHTYVSASSSQRTAHSAVYAVFRARIIDETIGAAPELLTVRKLLQRASEGLHLRPNDDIVGAIAELPDLEPLDRYVSLLRVLARLTTVDATPLGGDATSSLLSATARDRVATACRYVADHYADGKISRDDVARIVHLSPTAFSRLFTVSMGRPFSCYVNEVRVGAARGLLLSDEPVSKIAVHVGYRNLANFNRKFRELTGCSPTEYRRARASQLHSGSGGRTR